VTGAGAAASEQGDRWASLAGVRRIVRDQPVLPLLGLLLLLVLTLQLVQPGTVSAAWVGTSIKLAIPLAILAACQTLTMLTGGIDLSVAFVASMSAYLMATQAPVHGPVIGVSLALLACALAGLANGIGVGTFRVHPLIMTLATSLVVVGLMTVYQVRVVSEGADVPAEITWISGANSFGVVPNALLLFVPLAALILWVLRRWGFGRLLYAIGDNEGAARLAGVRVWGVHVTLYVISGLLAGIAGLVIAGITNVATVTLAEKYLLPSVAAAVIGGTSIFGGRGGYAGSIVGALILTVLTTLLTVMRMPEAMRQILFGAMIVAVAAAYTRITEER
jgi:ribose transport system permease protein